MRTRIGLVASLLMLTLFCLRRSDSDAVAQQAGQDPPQPKAAPVADAPKTDQKKEAKAFKYVNLATAELGAKESKILEQLKKEGTTASVEVVKLDVAAFQGDSVVMNLAAGASPTYEKIRSTPRGEHGFLWSGQVADAAPIAHFSIRDSSGTGMFKAGEGTYNLRPLGNGLHALIRRKAPTKEDAKQEEPPEAMKKIESEATQKEAPQVNPAAEAAPPKITVMVLYTPDVADNHPNIANFINDVVDITNSTYALSNVPMKIELVHQEQVNYTESNDVAEDVDRLTSTSDGTIDAIHALRDSHKADCVVMMIDHADAYGMAAAIMATPTTAFAVVDDEVADWYFTFAHELGHLFGCRHNLSADPNTAPFPYGHCYCNSAKQWRTIMSYDCTGASQRIGIWSSPLLKHPAGTGDPAGSASDEDNCRVLRQTAATVAAFR